MKRKIKWLLVSIFLCFTFVTAYLVKVSRDRCYGNSTAAKIEMSSIAQALETYAYDCGRYPSTAEGLAALMHRPDSCAMERWGPDPYVRFYKKVLGLTAESFFNLQNQNHLYNYSSLTLEASSALVLVGLRLQKMLAGSSYSPPVDPWGQPYNYISEDGKNYRLSSSGDPRVKTAKKEIVYPDDF